MSEPNGIQVSVDEAYEVALRALGEAVVRERLVTARYAEAVAGRRAAEDEAAGLRVRLADVKRPGPP